MVVDGMWATVGSTNLDHRSFALNEELNLVVYDQAVASRLERAFQDDLRFSTRLTYESWKGRGIASRLLELLAFPIKEQL
jgi:cardiolipin synthase